MQTDVMASTVAVSGTGYAARTRLRGIIAIPGSANGTITFKDGGSSGTTMLSIPTVANTTPFNIFVPGEGVVFETDVYVALSGTGTQVTFFYG